MAERNGSRKRQLAEDPSLWGTLAPRPWEELVLSPIKAIELEAAGLPDVISLAQGIPSFDTPEEIKQFVVQHIRDGSCARYTLSPGLPRLREQIAETLKQDGMHYDPDSEIIVTCGSIEGLSASLLALFEPGCEVLLPSPSYTSYLSALKLAGLHARFVPLDEDRSFDLDPERCRQAVTSRTRAILIAQPNNPTGTIFSPEAVRSLLDLAERHNLIVISDEVYKDFVYVERPVMSPARWPDFRHRTVRICSFSKAFAMTGWRVGFLHTDRNLAARILRAHDALVTCAPVASQYGALAALEHGEKLVRRFREELRARRRRMIEHLDSLPWVFDYQTPQASYFAFPRIKDGVPCARDSMRLARELLRVAKVAVVPGVAFGPTGEGHLRFCFARSTEEIDRAFERIRDFFLPKTRELQVLKRAGIGFQPVGSLGSRPSKLRRRLASLTLKTLTKAALRHRPIIIGITGGRGKTVVKRTLTGYLGQHFQVRSNPLSYNTQIGLPLAILNVRIHHIGRVEALLRCILGAVSPTKCDVLILELGIAAPGDMRALLDVVEPDLAVVTPVAHPPAGDPELVRLLLQEIEVLCARMRSRQKVILACADDPALRTLDGLRSAQWFGSECFIRTHSGWLAKASNSTFPLRRDWAGQSELYALAASLRIGELLGVPADKTQAFLAAAETGAQHDTHW